MCLCVCVCVYISTAVCGWVYMNRCVLMLCANTETSLPLCKAVWDGMEEEVRERISGESRWPPGWWWWGGAHEAKGPPLLEGLKAPPLIEVGQPRT